MNEVAASFSDILNAARRAISPYDDAADQEVRVCAKAYLRSLRKLACSAGDPGQSRARTYWLSNQPAAKLCALLLSYPKGKPALPLSHLQRKAWTMNVRRPSGEAVRIEHQPKLDGGTRPITKLGMIARANATLLGHVLQARWEVNPHEFCRRGRGREAAVRETLKAIKNGGVRYLGEADVESFFASFSREGVIKGVGLPRSMTSNNLLIPEGARVIHTHNDKAHFHISEAADLAGLPQGSPPSSLIASKLLQPVLGSLGGRLGISYVDNILVGGKTREEVVAKLDALASSLREHPAGPFHLKYSRTFKVGKECDYLGYWFRKQGRQYGGFARATPSKRSIWRGQQKLLSQLVFASSRHHATFIEQWSQKWASQYSAWGGRRDGIGNAQAGAIDRVSPVARGFRQHFHRERATFSSFQELRDIATQLGQRLAQDPFYKPLANWGEHFRPSLQGVGELL